MAEAAMLADGRMPVLIPAFNNPTYVAGMVRQLLRFPDLRPVVLDNGSTFPPALDLYRAWAAEGLAPGRVLLLLLGQNFGPRAAWQDPGFLSSLPRHFCLTDPDLELNPELPADFPATLLRVTQQFSVGKAGFALSLDDAHLMVDTPFRHADGWKRIWESEAVHWRDPVEAPGIAEPLFRADIDTTFALYDRRHFNPARPFRSIRVAGRFTARHLPWYRDTGLPAAEEAFYRRAAEYSYYMGDRPAVQLRPLFARQDALMAAGA
ncbi:glycosyltransferase family protein [Roseicella aquatilis]|uniref:Glycosyltransferase family 2 protein n=1 Tax=Roseicella aquatilis TaxID=2527868 RepID=A0A4R4DT15_9PROT|nr:glycosyltransferase [Roseicella aquatilis]TCZ63043.1 hypothetical protein EXY23_11785 [Roseicella aquatilis]